MFSLHPQQEEPHAETAHHPHPRSGERCSCARAGANDRNGHHDHAGQSALAVRHRPARHLPERDRRSRRHHHTQRGMLGGHVTSVRPQPDGRDLRGRRVGHHQEPEQPRAIGGPRRLYGRIHRRGRAGRIHRPAHHLNRLSPGRVGTAGDDHLWWFAGDESRKPERECARTRPRSSGIPSAKLRDERPGDL